MNKKLIITIFALIILSALFIRVRASLPVARVEGASLLWEDFSKHRDGLARFRDLNKESISDSDIERGVIFSFIENTLIAQELERRGKREDDARRVIYENIDESEFEKIEAATGQLYGWSISDFEKFVIYPQARRTMLADELDGERADFGAWLEKSMDEAKISVYLWRWGWKNGELKERF